MVTTRAWFACLAVAVAYPVAAVVTEDVQYATYQVKSQQGVDLRTLLRRATPIRQDGRSYLGSANPRISWKLSFVLLPNGHCRIQRVATTLAVTIMLPGSSDHAISDNGAFRVFITRLKAHELGHYQIARDTAVAIDKAIVRLPESNSCAALTATANNLGNDLWSYLRQQQQAYDNGTEHGRSQGAWLEQ